MSHPFETLERQNRPWNIRFLENQSPRTVFVMLLLEVFVLGALSFMLVYEIVLQHRFDVSTVLMLLTLVLFGISATLSSIAIYRHLRD